MTPAQNSGNFESSENLPNIHFNKQQKIGLSVLLFFTLLVIVMWYLDLKKNIIYPLYGGINPTELNKQINNSAVNANNVQDKDTDKDGILDYQEISIYKTSPFLADSDGDGLSDKQEIDAKTDPNCPQGKTCGESNLVITEESSLPIELLSGDFSKANQTDSQLNADLLNQLNQTAPNASQVANSGLSQQGAATLKQIFGDKPNPQVLRQSFLEAASTKEDKQMITNMNDDQLLQVYQIMIANN